MLAVCFGFIFNTPIRNPCVEFLTHTCWTTPHLFSKPQPPKTRLATSTALAL